MTQRRNENDVLIPWINDQRADLMGIFQTNIFPCLSAVHRFEDSGAVSGIAADRCFARACVNDVVVRWGNRNGANRGNRFFIKKRHPVRAAINRFPNSARDRTEIIRVRFADDTFDRQRAAAPERSDLSPLHALEQFFIDCARWRWGGGWSRSKRSWEKKYRNRENDANQSDKRTIRRDHPPKVKSLRLRSTGFARNRPR